MVAPPQLFRRALKLLWLGRFLLWTACALSQKQIQFLHKLIHAFGVCFQCAIHAADRLGPK